MSSDKNISTGTAMGRIRAASRVITPALLVPPAIFALTVMVPQTANASTTSSPASSSTASKYVSVDAELAAYLAAGYDYDDAVVLARFWCESSPYQAKLVTGEALIKGGGTLKTIDFQHGETASTVSDDFARGAYYNNGYDYADAQSLAKLWGQSDISTVKTTAGRKILAGIKLPA